MIEQAINAEMNDRRQAPNYASPAEEPRPLDEEIKTSKPERSVKGAIKANTNYICLYLCSFAGFGLIWQTFHDIGLSTLLTFSVLVQVIALSALLLAINMRKSCQGVSMKSIAMQGLSFFLRLCSTSWLKGYIPVDSTGDWLYQLADVSALLLCGAVLYVMNCKYYNTYNKNEDTFMAPQVCVCCFLLAVIIHPDLNNRPFFDAIWTSALYVDVVSTLPQLWMIGKIGGKVDALSAHYVALIAFSRSVDMIFWYYGFEELAPENGSFNLAGWTVLSAHLIHLILVWDFIYCYIRAMWKSGTCLDKELDFGGMMLDV